MLRVLQHVRISTKTSSRSSSSSSSSSSEKVQALIDFLRLQARLDGIRGEGGFSHSLGLSASPQTTTTTTRTTPDDDDDGSDNDSNHFVQPSQFSFIDSQDPHLPLQPSLVFRYRLPKYRLMNIMKNEGIDCQPSTDRHIHLSTLTSILDEVTTLGMIAATLPAYPRPGVSVTMATEWGPAAASLSSCTTVDIVTTLTKRGQNMGFLRAEVTDPMTGGVICFFHHTKYLPVGWVLSMVLSPPGIWGLKVCSDILFPILASSSGSSEKTAHKSVSPSTTTDDIDILHSFQMTSESSATFEVASQHTNGFGGLHGGVQSILMERLGRQVAYRAFLNALPSSPLDSDDSATSSRDISIECERLQMSFQSSASKHVELQAFILQQQQAHSVTVRIVILRGRGKERRGQVTPPSKSAPSTVVVSEGILTFVRTHKDALVQNVEAPAV